MSGSAKDHIENLANCEKVPPPVPSTPPSIGRVLALKYYKKVSKSLAKGFRRSASGAPGCSVNSNSHDKGCEGESETETETEDESIKSETTESSGGGLLSSESMTLLPLSTSTCNTDTCGTHAIADLNPKSTQCTISNEEMDSYYENVDYFSETSGTLKLKQDNLNTSNFKTLSEMVNVAAQNEGKIDGEVDTGINQCDYEEEDDDSSKWETSLSSNSNNTNNNNSLSNCQSSSDSCSCKNCQNGIVLEEKLSKKPDISEKVTVARVAQRPGNIPPPPPIPKFPSSSESSEDSFSSCASNPVALAALPDPVLKSRDKSHSTTTTTAAGESRIQNDLSDDDDTDPTTDVPRDEPDMEMDDDFPPKISEEYDDLVQAVTQTLTLTLNNDSNSLFVSLPGPWPTACTTTNSKPNIKNVLNYGNISYKKEIRRPETGPGIDTAPKTSNDDLISNPEEDREYQNVFVTRGKISPVPNPSNSTQIPFPVGSINHVILSESGVTTIEEHSDDATPIVHAVINLPPRMMSLIKQRRRKTEDLTYQRASRLSRLMLADYKAAGLDRPDLLSASVIGKSRNRINFSSDNTSNNSNSSCNVNSSSKTKGLKGSKFSLKGSKVERMGKSVSTMRRKMGSWYQRRVKTPVEHMIESTDKSKSSGSCVVDGQSQSNGHDASRPGSRAKSRLSRGVASPIPVPYENESDYLYSPVAGDCEVNSSGDFGSGVGESFAIPGFVSCIKKGQNEFEDLRRLVKQGGDFCKDLAAVLHERSELESQYAKGLSKLSAKLLKASKEATGSVAHAWQAVAVQIDTQAELHRQWSTALSEELARPLRNSTETQHKIRKSVEVLVEKTTRNLADWRTAEAKAKRQCFSSSKEFEKLQDHSPAIIGNSHNNSANQNNANINGLNNVNSNSNSVLSEVRSRSRLLTSVPPVDKDPIKLEAKRRKAEETVRRADVEYYTFCVRSERARLEWEGAIRNGSTCLRTMEEEKLSLLRDLALKYYQHLNDFAPKLVSSVEALEQPVKGCNIDQDMHSIMDIRRHVGAEQLLPDFYAEDTSNLMKRDRRYEALQKFMYLINQDLERERKGAVGVETLAKAIADGPIDNSHHDISDKLYYMRSMLLYLEASRCKVDNAIADVEGRQRNNNPLTQYIRHQRDKQGLPQTILKVPSWARDDCLAYSTSAGSGGSAGSNSPNWHDRGNADGTSGQHDTDFDEFGSDGSVNETVEVFGGECKIVNNKNLISVPSIGKCRAIYDYDANLFDELTIRVGDEINIHDKQEDGWWLGELNSVVGIFPATYVEEIPPGPSPTSD